MPVSQEVLDQWEREYNEGRMEFGLDVDESNSADEIEHALKAFAHHHSFAINISSRTVVDPESGQPREVVRGRRLVAPP
jgi:hypothetical protein